MCRQQLHTIEQTETIHVDLRMPLRILCLSCLNPYCMCGFNDLQVLAFQLAGTGEQNAAIRNATAQALSAYLQLIGQDSTARIFDIVDAFSFLKV